MCLFYSPASILYFHEALHPASVQAGCIYTFHLCHSNQVFGFSVLMIPIGALWHVTLYYLSLIGHQCCATKQYTGLIRLSQCALSVSICDQYLVYYPWKRRL